MALGTHRHRHVADIEVFVTCEKKDKIYKEKQHDISDDIYKQSQAIDIQIEILFFSSYD